MLVRRAVTIALALPLCACGGGQSGGTSASPVAVAPSAVAAPAPTPSPAPTATPEPVAAADPVPATPVAAAPAGYRSGVYVGNDVPDLLAYEAWLGRRTDGVQLHTGRAGWWDWSSSISWLADRWKDVDRENYWSIPLFAEGADLAEASRGAYNQRYRDAAATLVAARPGTAKIFVRTGWEFNGNWQPWAAKGKEAEYREAFRQFVASFRSVSDRFVFEWTPNQGDHGMNPEDAYPGDDVVDVIGMDFYYNHEWDAADPVAAWQYKVNERYGLAWHQAFAQRHGKPTAYSEWGVSSDADAPYVALAAKWFAEHDVLYAIYWNSDAAYRGKLSGEQYPSVTGAYKALATARP